MKKWNVPEVAELNISETANGFFDVDVEGPFDVVFGDHHHQKPNDNNDKTNQES